jgi:pantoate--beta-alanine ligase
VRTVTTIAEARAVLDAVRGEGGRVGLVPTMGYLHDGHASLIDRADRDGSFVFVTIFVNPLQFGPTEDLGAYPRDLERDAAICEAHGAGLVLAPSVEEMYPVPVLTTVTVAGLSEPMEGASRPTHFAGVATVVAKLFAIAGTCRAYFGEKDWQQLCVVRRVAADLSLPVEVIGCPIVREPDGLALSSRNVYLSATQRSAAPVLQRALLAGRAAILAGERSAAAVTDLMAGMIEDQSLADLDYVAVVDAATLEVTDPLGGELRLLAAARFGRARLLDNVGVVAG